MSKKEKLLRRFFEVPIRRDLKFKEFLTLMRSFGFSLHQREGSRVIFYNNEIHDSFSLHQPHGSHCFKCYQVKDIQKFLKKLHEKFI